LLLEPGALTQLPRTTDRDDTSFCGQLLQAKIELENEAAFLQLIEVREHTRYTDSASEQMVVDVINVHNVNDTNVLNVMQIEDGQLPEQADRLL
jgi:hypothetical protein